MGELRGRDEKVRTLLALHPDRVILTGLTTPDSSQRLPLDPTSLGVVGSVHRLVDYFVSLEWIVIVVELHPSDDIVRTGFIQGRAGAFDEDSIVGLFFVDENPGGVDITRVALDAQPDSLLLIKRSPTVDASLFVAHLFTDPG